jgi:sporulation protein YlmC with PRC-barrel domain
MRTYYLFQAGSDPELQAVADDPTGDKLPAENGPWVLVRQLSSDEDWPHTTTREVVAAGVAANGFVLIDTDTGQRPSTSKPVIESDRVEGTAVYDPSGKHIGTIKRLMIEKVSGRVTYAVMTFGGFLSIGSHEHTIPWDKLRYDTRLGGYRTDVTEEQLRGAPSVFADREVWPDRPREQEVHDYWRIPPYWRGL